MAAEGPAGSSTSGTAGSEEVNRSFDGFDEDEERDDNMVDMGAEGGRRRIFSKVCQEDHL